MRKFRRLSAACSPFIGGRRRDALAVALTLAGVGCTSNVAQPTPPLPGITIRNLQYRSLGLQPNVCTVLPRSVYESIDEVTFDFTTVDGNLDGGVVRIRSEQVPQGAPIGRNPLRACDLTQPSCSNIEQACIVAGSATTSGTIRAHRLATWTPSTTIGVTVVSGFTSNELVTTFARSETLPYGDRAQIASLTAAACSTTERPFSRCYVDPAVFGPGYNMWAEVYQPAIENRSTLATLEVYSITGNQRVTRQQRREQSAGFVKTWELGATILPQQGLPAPPYRIVVDLEEFAGGIKIGEHRQEITYP